MPQQDEFGLIRLLTSGRGAAASLKPGSASGGSGVAVGIGDDAAVLDGSAGFQWVVTCDTMVRDIHFKPETMTWNAIGHKALASNISDLAAMGALPRFALVAISIPADVSEAALVELYDGLYGCAEQYGVAIVGGDTTSCPRDMTVTVTAIGQVEEGKAVLRSGARTGDAVFLTGPLGLSAAGLKLLLKRGGSAYDTEGLTAAEHRLAEAHQRPLPQVEAGRRLVQSGKVHSLNDISDGLASEAWELAESSGCVLVLEEEKLPLDPDLADYAAETKLNPVDLMLYGGEDYQLVGTAGEESMEELAALFLQAGIPFYRIGSVREAKEAPGVELRGTDGNVIALAKRGYNHFNANQPT